MDPRLEEKLSSLPDQPGVYLMKDRSGQIIYVGKALSLRSRVRSYFNRGGSDSRPFVSLLDRTLGELETVVTSNEKEALLLENELIKKHKPRFNVQLRDDKNFICLRLDLAHPYPRLEVVRRFQRDGARYFGPYSSASSIRETLRIINRYFQLRTCTDQVLESRRRPCLLFQLGRCPAPCVYDLPQQHYRKSVEEVILFLEGKAGELARGLKERRNQAAAELRFEEAAQLRDQLVAIERSLERQQVAGSEAIDQDVFGFFRQADRLLVYVLFLRQGRVTGGQAFPASGQEFPDEQLLASFVNLFYASENFVPREVLLPLAIPEPEALEELLSERKGERVRVLFPRRGKRAELLRLARKNAQTSFGERRRSQEELGEVLERLRDRLGLKSAPRRMECIDVSHFQGASLVASLVAMTEGELDKARYRRFKIKGVAGNDDFASVHEVVSRRLRRGLEERELPELLLIDGGKGQLASALAAMRDLGVEGVALAALAKSRDLEVADRDQGRARSPERIFLPGRKEPLVLPQSSPELFLLTRLRDEAHRFAITFQQKLHRKRNLSSALEEIRGVGEGRQRALLRHFGSLQRVRLASLEQLSEVEGLGPAMAEKIHAFFHGPRGF